MTAHASSAASSRILRFWHKVEFFIPFDLQQQVYDAKDAEQNVRRFSEPALQGADTTSLWQVPMPAGRKLCGFEVYLGVFDKLELARVTERVVHEALSPNDDFDQTERGELEGATCFARIKLNAQGEPQFDEVSVSTAPWALGHIQQHGLDGLDFDAFQTGVQSLKDALQNFRAARAPIGDAAAQPSSEAGGDGQTTTKQPLTALELLALLDIFYGWAAYRPERPDPNAPVIAIRAKSIEKRAKTVNPHAKSAAQTTDSAVTDADDEEDGLSDDAGIDILNSFYAKDIERAIAALESGTDCPTLTAYLTPILESSRIDLYQSTGRKHLTAALQPCKLNLGHWLDEPHHAMSLMQQFAINSTFEQVRTAGVFSVNGPPGTGKTTLLRDIFAENVTRRARSLAKFDAPGGAFLPEGVTVNFNDTKDPCKIAVLREEVAGFEMVVASSNNAAVENISRDLPKTKALGKTAWRNEQGRAKLGYLQPVAHNVAAKTAKGEYEKLNADDEPWGLISCALGKKSNRTAFVDRISFAGAKSPEKPPKGFDPELHQSLWMWCKRYQGASFAEARQTFLKADRDVAQRIKQLDRYARLQAELRDPTLTSYTATAAQHEQQSQQMLVTTQADFKATDDELHLCKNQLAALQAEETLIEKVKPGWWARLLRRPACQQYCDDLATNHQAQRRWLHRKLAAEEPRLAAQKALQQASAVHGRAQQALAVRQTEWNSKQPELLQLTQEFPRADQPEQVDDLERDHWQIDGLWRDDALNRLRSELFAAALKLHEAWLAEVLKKGGRFGANVVAFRHLLSGKRLQEAQHALAIWQSLFMVVPVVSSTFASFASQFRDLGPNSLGWLFIDEAGQAVPQAAVGALWRARRAVVVGDPLQIEPVFTVPIKLIEALAKSSDSPEGADVAPHRTSVQNLADAANRLGARIGSYDHPQWIGSPLRVHRRCVDPMFSIANEIAYEGKMIFFDPTDPTKRLPPEDSLDIGSSAWVHAPGAADAKQSVPIQIDLVHRALVALYRRTGTLPPIYIISPFKRIKTELITRISNQANWNALAALGDIVPPKKTQLRAWCRERIGTVHTFQGKEESIVWMVLGCDEDSRGAASWAASKPNLLNVALTRAKHRFFMIGDAGLWGGLRHFDAARRELLPLITPDEFLQRLGRPESVVTPNMKEDISTDEALADI